MEIFFKKILSLILVAVQITNPISKPAQNGQPNKNISPPASLVQKMDFSTPQLAIDSTPSILSQETNFQTTTPNLSAKKNEYQGYHPQFELPKFSFTPKAEEHYLMLFNSIKSEPSKSQIKALLNKLQIASTNPTEEELYERLAIFMNEQHQETPESNYDIASIIEQIKENTNNYLTNYLTMEEAGKFTPGLPDKDYKKLEYIYITFKNK